MNQDSDQEKAIIEFLMSCPEAVPSPAQKARAAAMVRREIAKTRAARMSSMDVLFVFLLLAATLVLSLFGTWLPELSTGLILNQFYHLQFLHRIILCFGIAGFLTAPLLLTILPLNKGGNH